MKRLADQLERDRALRDDAWGVVREDVTLMRADLEQRSVGGRIKDRVSSTARDVASDALKAAGQHRALLGASVLGLALWLGRGPLLGALRGLLPGRDVSDAADDDLEQE